MSYFLGELSHQGDEYANMLKQRLAKLDVTAHSLMELVVISSSLYSAMRRKNWRQDLRDGRI
ncbi:hypothetical protein [Cohaesibacter celericrescens]|uniref:hypothetical protein n=1 Tax=Cohaesibacter celericrescens TaxID=2067669 RepID=UPI0011AF8F58|nr:hypothetical protein [Cohaesibacter celericrescens]